MVELELKLIRKVVPHNLLGSTFIAGGAAIAPQSADDIDVWIFHSPMEMADTINLQQEIAHNLWKEGRPRGVQLFGLDGIPEDCGSARTQEECEMYQMAIESDWKDLGINLLLTYQPMEGAGKRIQFLSVGAPGKGIMDLLERFDISSQVWATPVGVYDAGLPYSVLLRSTLPSAPPRVVRWSTPASTLKRLTKLCTRYGWDIRTHPDLPRLQELAEKAGNRYNGGLPSKATLDGTAPF